MQIVIDTRHCPCRTLDDECYISDDECYEEDICSECPLIRNGGVKLPKGHGRLGDLDVLSNYFWDNRSKLYTHKDLQIAIDNAKAVVPADTESGGEE